MRTQERLSFRETVERKRPRLYVSRDGGEEIRLTRFKKGVYSFGDIAPADFIRENRTGLLSSLPGLTDSSINVMAAVAENEGNMDAVNTWDNSFMTFGMFQWTIGAGSGRGELPALLERIRDGWPETFARHYGRRGLDIAESDGEKGFLSLDGEKLASPAQKEALRANEWAFYFAESGKDPDVCAAQAQHALFRLSRFYRAGRKLKGGYDVADLVTSEYGVALILDNHVNRPNYVKHCLDRAMKETRLSRPEGWGTDEERAFLASYLEIRETYGKHPMTDAGKRAAVTAECLEMGDISDERGSFDEG